MLKSITNSVALTTTALLLSACGNIAADKPEPAAINGEVVDAALSGMVDNGRIAGASALVYSADQEIYYGDEGMADKEAGAPITRDTKFTIYSMTKPVTGVTLMSLWEDGLFDLDAPLSDYLPEFANMKVFAGMNEDGTPNLVPTERPILVMDIFRHTACFTYGWENDYVGQTFREAAPLDPSKPLSQFSTDLATVPLACQPGQGWEYSVSVDVQARLAEVVSGRPYEELVYERVLEPLGMSDTSYFVLPAERDGLAVVYFKSEDGALTRAPDEAIYSRMAEKPLQINGGHGLISTIDDYMTFALMLQNEGSYKGAQILKPETVAFMATDHLPEGLTDTDKHILPGKGQMGFGIDFAVRIAEPVNADELYGKVGEFFWDGAPSTLFWVDPENDITVVFMTQVMPFDDGAHRIIRSTVYEALDMK